MKTITEKGQREHALKKQAGEYWDATYKQFKTSTMVYGHETMYYLTLKMQQQ